MKRTIQIIASAVAIASFLIAISASMPLTETDNRNGSTAPTPTGEQEVWLESLLTDTPQEGRELAVKLARRSIATIQTDPEIRKQLRSAYDTDTEQLILSAQVIAIEFQTIAAANQYWRD